MRVLAFALVTLLCACASTPRGELPHAIPDRRITATESLGATHLTWARLDSLNWPEPQRRFRGYNDTVKNELWAIYSNGGTELYCRYEFSPDEARAKAVVLQTHRILITWEHAFPADSIAAGLGFADRYCTEPETPSADVDTCEAAIADMHNLWPAFGPVNSSRGNHPFAEIEGEGTNSDNFPYCPDFERTHRQTPTYIEPDDAARGDIARALIYMHYVYGLPLEAVVDDPDRLLDWANADPVDREELGRDEAIRESQLGSWNPLIAPADPIS